MFNAKRQKLGQTWVEIDGEIYGAKPDQRGPIGGGVGYTNLISPMTDSITTLDELLDVLTDAKSGDVIYIQTLKVAPRFEDY